MRSLSPGRVNFLQKRDLYDRDVLRCDESWIIKNRAITFDFLLVFWFSSRLLFETDAKNLKRFQVTPRLDEKQSSLFLGIFIYDLTITMGIFLFI